MKSLVIRLENETHYNLRKVSFLTELTMSEIVREGINATLNKYAKILNNNRTITIDDIQEENN